VFQVHGPDETAAPKGFRVAEDGTASDVGDAHLAIHDGAQVSVLHPIDLEPDVLQQWRRLFEDYRIVQPIPQLDRPIHDVTIEEQARHEIERPRADAVPVDEWATQLRNRGWTQVQYTNRPTLRRAIDGGVEVTVDHRELLIVRVARGGDFVHWGTVDRRMRTELLYELGAGSKK
jgi:hypothetical protein